MDSKILSKLNPSVRWSKCTKEEYSEIQEQIENHLKNQTLDAELKNLGNMAYDFLEW